MGLSKYILVLIAFLIIFPHKSLAVSIISGDRVSVDRDVGDVIITGGEITVIGNVKGDLIAAGGEILVRSNIYGDVIITGGDIEIDGDVSGKVMVAGGEITIDGNVDKFVMMAGGDVNIGRNAIIGDDVFAAGGSIKNQGVVKGNLTAMGGRYLNSGIIEGYESFRKIEGIPWYLSEIFKAGLLVLGLLLVYMVPSLFEKGYLLTTSSLIESAKITALGFAFVLLSLIIGLALIFTIIGALTGIFLILLTVTVIVVSNLVVSYSIGRYAVSRKIKNHYAYLALGFIVIYLLSKFPYAGGLIMMVSTFLGTGAVLRVVWDMKSENTQFRG